MTTAFSSHMSGKQVGGEVRTGWRILQQVEHRVSCWRYAEIDLNYQDNVAPLRAA